MISFLKSGDVVLADLGMVAKVRPCVVLCARPDSQRNVAIIAPLTTETRGGECEVAFQKPPWLAQECVLNLAGILGIEMARVQRRLGPFPRENFREAKRILAKVFDLQDPPALPDD
jgi:mRNA-degrading endonuclease toxin of MazEF toxin-antitoxin module